MVCCQIFDGPKSTFIKNSMTKLNRFNIDFKANDITTHYLLKNLSSYDLIHFAGHCEHDCKQPHQSGWVFKDGRITANDFLSKGENVALPSIIFANACESARTDCNILASQSQRNIYNPAHSLLLAGVKHYTALSVTVHMILAFFRIKLNCPLKTCFFHHCPYHAVIVRTGVKDICFSAELRR